MKNRTPVIIVAWLLLMLGPWVIDAPGQQPVGERPQLGSAPTFPKDITGLRLPEPTRVEAPAPQAEGPIFSVNPANREASRTFFLTYYQNAAAPAHGWTGNRTTCDAGTTSAAFKDAVLLRINYFRAMAGVPAQVTLADTYSAKAQQAALIMSVNNQLSHNPPTTWQCYTADGAEAAGNSDLFLGVYGWDAITGYIRDPGGNNGPVGHRRWILYPQTQNMGTGDIPPDGGRAANSLWVFDSHVWEARPPTRDTFVAWPPPGYVPYQVVFPRWSFSYPGANFSQASATMTRDGQSVPLRLETAVNGYGENTIAWAITGMEDWDPWPKPAADIPYRVTISNAIVGSTPTTFTYDVVVMDPAQTSLRPVLWDLTGDRKSDIVWRHTTRGEVWLWPMDGAVRTTETRVGTVADTNWEIRGLGDQNGDGKADILWRNKLTGMIYFWPMNGSTPLAETYVARVDLAYDIVGTGDYNGDGKSDILWRHLTNGEVWIWLMNGAAPLSEMYVDTVDPGYVVKGSGDLNGDTKADIVWHHGTRGEVWVWLMNGTTRISQTYIGTVGDVGYKIVGVADHTGDGKADILWHHATRGEVWIWPMNGTTRVSQTYVDTVPDTGYQIVSNGDYNGDGKADILWHHATRGEVWVWLMDGTTKVSQTWVATVPEVGYRIVK